MCWPTLGELSQTRVMLGLGFPILAQSVRRQKWLVSTTDFSTVLSARHLKGHAERQRKGKAVAKPQRQRGKSEGDDKRSVRPDWDERSPVVVVAAPIVACLSLQYSDFQE